VLGRKIISGKKKKTYSQTKATRASRSSIPVLRRYLRDYLHNCMSIIKRIIKFAVMLKRNT